MNKNYIALCVSVTTMVSVGMIAKNEKENIKL